jgi:REP element-mobilizing transposase RayT
MPNSTYLVTRRCTQRQFLLLPSRRNVQIFTYCLALAAARTGVIVHAIVVIGNHYHAVITDPEARLSEFLAYLHKYVAKAINAGMGRWENLWASEKPSAVLLSDAQDVIDKIVYTVCNPVAAGLVAKADQWPGLVAYLPGTILKVDRPTVYFKEDGTMPKSASVTIEKPPQLARFSDGLWAELIQKEVEQKQRQIQEGMEKAGRSFMGAKKVLQQMRLWGQALTHDT